MPDGIKCEIQMPAVADARKCLRELRKELGRGVNVRVTGTRRSTGFGGGEIALAVVVELLRPYVVESLRKAIRVAVLKLGVSARVRFKPARKRAKKAKQRVARKAAGMPRVGSGRNSPRRRR